MQISITHHDTFHVSKTYSYNTCDNKIKFLQQYAISAQIICTTYPFTIYFHYLKFESVSQFKECIHLEYAHINIQTRIWFPITGKKER